jgi:hypothetical protein
VAILIIMLLVPHPTLSFFNRLKMENFTAMPLEPDQELQARNQPIE